MAKRIQAKKTLKLCDCDGIRTDIHVEIARTHPFIGHSELNINYEICANCACQLSEGGLKKNIKKALQDMICPDKNATPFVMDYTLPTYIDNNGRVIVGRKQ